MADAEELDHENAAKMMGISRPTFSRLVAEARHIVATALVNRWALRIDGGDYWVDGDSPLDKPCSGRGRKRRGCRRRGQIIEEV